jgi:predicted ATP-dependent endonuclease of OLD family
MGNKEINYRILQFKGENFKRLKVINITPGSNSVIISGRNEQGKSSILDAIQAALAGKDSLKDIPDPVRKGQDKAEIKIDLGEYIITRTFTQKDSYLKVTSRDGASYKNPQTILNNLFNKSTIDPSIFLSQDDERQFRILRSIVKIEVDFDRLEDERKLKYEERTLVNKEIQSLQVRLNAMPQPAVGLPGEEKQAGEIVEEIQEANEVIAANKKLRNNLTDTGKDFFNLKEQKIEIINNIKSLSLELEDVEAGLVNYRHYGIEMQEKVTALIDPDVSLISIELSNIESTNKKIRDAKEYFVVEESLSVRKQKAEKLSGEINELIETKRTALKNVEFPVKGLGFSENGITFKGIPFIQCSQEEKIKVALSIAMAQDPKLKVILIRDGSLLDKNNLALIQRLAKEKNYQVWIERVDDTGESGIIIEDGTVKIKGKAGTKRVKRKQKI